ncbi:MAG: sugar phosphate nucleotidyltransferase [bacterium]
MKGMILAAGKGTRLRPYTEIIPKPLIPLANRALICYNLDILGAAGISEVIINLHHLAADIEGFFKANPYPGIKVSFSFEPELLGTGGGIRKVEAFMAGESLAIINGDILTDFPLSEMIGFHRAGKALATLALSRRPDLRRYGGVGVDSQGSISCFPHQNKEAAVKQGVFLGIQIVEPELVSRIPAGIFSCIVKDNYAHMLKEKRILGLFDRESYWRDLGTPQSYLEAHLDLFQHEKFRRMSGLGKSHLKLPDDLKLDRSVELIPPVVIGKGCRIGKSCRVGPGVSLGEQSVLEPGVEISSSIVWPRSRLSGHTSFINRICFTPKKRFH